MSARSRFSFSQPLVASRLYCTLSQSTKTSLFYPERWNWVRFCRRIAKISCKNCDEYDISRYYLFVGFLWHRVIAEGLGLVMTRARFSLQDGGTWLDFENGLFFRPASGLSSTRIPFCQRGNHSIRINLSYRTSFFSKISFPSDFFVFICRLFCARLNIFIIIYWTLFLSLDLRWTGIAKRKTRTLE